MIDLEEVYVMALLRSETNTYIREKIEESTWLKELERGKYES